MNRLMPLWAAVAATLAASVLTLPLPATADSGPAGTLAPAPNHAATLHEQLASATPLVDWKRTTSDGAKSFTYSMVGRNPFVARANAATTVKAYLQPIKFHFDNGHEWDATVADSCDPGASPL